MNLTGFSKSFQKHFSAGTPNEQAFQTTDGMSLAHVFGISAPKELAGYLGIRAQRLLFIASIESG